MHKYWKTLQFLDISHINWTIARVISIIMVFLCTGNIVLILYILSVGRKALVKGGEMMEKTSIRVYFTGERNGAKRNFSKTVNFINPRANNDALGAFKGAFSALLGKEISRAVKITVAEL